MPPFQPNAAGCAQRPRSTDVLCDVQAASGPTRDHHRMLSTGVIAGPDRRLVPRRDCRDQAGRVTSTDGCDLQPADRCSLSADVTGAVGTATCTGHGESCLGGRPAITTSRCGSARSATVSSFRYSRCYGSIFRMRFSQTYRRCKDFRQATAAYRLSPNCLVGRPPSTT